MAYDARRPSTWRQTKRPAQFTPNVPAQGIGVEYTTGKRWIIYLDRKKIGHIFEIESTEGSTFQYMPLHSKSGGEVFATFAQCRRSLDEDNG
jgi:hypothetical protein